jgi:hypothetical protein
VSLREDLESGRTGVSFRAPPSFEWIEESAQHAIARDAERRVTWFIRRLPFRFDLRKDFDDVLRNDLEEDARFAFEQAYEASPSPPGPPGSSGPRTRDPAWSPIVERALVRLGAAPAVRLVWRLSYQPEKESVSAEILIPVAQGHFAISAIANARITGFRETATVMKLEKERGEAFGTRFPKQAEFDDPALDESFPDHPLTLSRAALRWLEGGAHLEVTAPDGEAPTGEVVAEAARCAITAPPRYVFVPRTVLPMADTLVSYVRAGLPDGSPRMLDIWRFPERLGKRNRERELSALAQKVTDGWRAEGAENVVHGPRVIGSDGASAMVEDFVRFKVGASEKLTAMRWRADEDGTVFRVSVGAGAYVAEARLVEQADVVMASLRRLDEAGAKKAWWQRF